MRSINVSRVVDGTQATASFKIGIIRQVLTGLDVSRAFPRLARVKIKDDEFVVQTDTVLEVGDGWSHEVELISPLKVLYDTTSAGLTITQPQGDIGLYFRSFSESLVGGILTDNAVEVSLTTIEQSEDLTEIEDRTLKKDKLYSLRYQITFVNNSMEGFVGYAQLKVGGITVANTIEIISGRKIFGKPVEKTISKVAEFQNVGVNDVKLYVWRSEEVGEATLGMLYRDVKLAISSTDEKTAEKITLDYVVEKILHNDANKQQFFLDDNSKAYLKGIYAYEWSFPESYIGLQLQRIAEYIKAYPSARFGEVAKKAWVFMTSTETELTHDMKITTEMFLTKQTFMRLVRKYAPTYPNGFILLIQDPSTYWYAEIQETIVDGLIVSMIPYNPTPQTPIGAFEKGIQATIDDYAASLEINAKNIYSEHNVIREITTLRADGDLRQIDVENIIIPTTQRVGEVVAMKIKVPTAITIGSEVYAAGDWVNIDTNRILRQEYYNTLGSRGEYNGAGRFAFSKNNTLYYIEGEQHIHGLSYLGETERKMFNDRTYIRAIYEIIIAQITRDNGDSGVDYTGTFDNGETARDDLIAVDISYRPYTETNAVVYKSDQSGFQFHTSKFLNETMALNSPDIIGAYTQAIADRSGGTVNSISGECLYDELPDLISEYNGMILFGVSFSFLTTEKVAYSLRYIKDFIFVSAYESYDKKERVYQVSRENTQDRVIKKNILIQFDTTENESEVDVVEFTKHLLGDFSNEFPIRAVFNHDGRNSTLPCVSQALGRVIEFRVGMKDNYSVGMKKTLVGSDTYQQDVRYTDDFGRVEETQVSFYREWDAPNLTQMNAMPERTSLVFRRLLADFYVLERKDARERSVYSMQFAYLSENSVIIIYDKIAKYANTLPQSIIRDIKWVEVSEIPSKQALTLDTSTIVRSATATRSGREITIDTIGANAVVCYNDTGKDKEILLVDTRKTLNRKIYFRGINK